MSTLLSSRTAALQTWLNLKGATPQLMVDGQPGPATRSAIIETFRNTAAPAVTQPEINLFAARIPTDPRRLATVARVESNGGGWDRSGLLTLLWERHYLWRRVQVAVPFLSNPSPGGYTVDADGDGINDSWEKLADASLRFGFGVAAECASFGKFQIMGAHWKVLGYSSVAEFVWQLSRTEAAHYEALCRYIRVFGLVDACRAIGPDPADCLDFARGYNGKRQKGYDAKLAEAFRRLS